MQNQLINRYSILYFFRLILYHIFLVDIMFKIEREKKNKSLNIYVIEIQFIQDKREF